MEPTTGGSDFFVVVDNVFGLLFVIIQPFVDAFLTPVLEVITPGFESLVRQILGGLVGLIA